HYVLIAALAVNYSAALDLPRCGSVRSSHATRKSASATSNTVGLRRRSAGLCPATPVGGIPAAPISSRICPSALLLQMTMGRLNCSKLTARSSTAGAGCDSLPREQSAPCRRHPPPWPAGRILACAAMPLAASSATRYRPADDDSSLM